MKRFFIIFFVFAFAALITSCKEEDGGEWFDIDISLKTTSVTLYASAGSETVVVDAKNVTWKPEVAPEAQEWLSAEKKNNTIVVTVKDNIQSADRTGKIFVRVTNSNRVEGTELSVLQYGQGTLNVSATSLEFEASGNEAKTFRVEATKLEWEVSSSDEWLTVIPDGNTVTVKVKDNPNYRKLTGTITVSPVNADYINPHIVKVTQSGMSFEADHTFTTMTGSYHGKVKVSDFARYSFRFGSGDAHITDEGAVEVGDGYLLQIDSLLGNIASNSTDIFLPAGRYEINNEDKALTIRPGGYNSDKETYYGTVLYENVAGVTSTTQPVPAGFVEVEKDDKNYKLYFVLKPQGGEEMKFYYEGKVELKNDTYLSTLTENREVEDLTGGKIKCTRATDDEEVNTWNLYIWTDGITVGDNGSASGEGRYFSLELYTNKNHTAELPEGSYAFNDTQAANSARIGYMESGAYKGSWYFEMKNGSTKPSEMAPFNGGSITVSSGIPEGETETEYTITVSGRDDTPGGPFTIKGAYRGKLTLVEQAP